MADMINKPPHYNKGAVEVWDFILDQGMGYLDGNAIKYICRYRHKGKPVEDLDKAIAFLIKLRDAEKVKATVAQSEALKVANAQVMQQQLADIADMKARGLTGRTAFTPAYKQFMTDYDRS